MAGIEEALDQLLGDPSKMAQVMSMVQSLGLGGPPEDGGGQQAPSGADDQMLSSLLHIMHDAQQGEPRQEALLCALKPYVRPERREKIDKALRIARISHIAGCAIRNFQSEG